jgi:hypothetical protein
VPSLPVSEKPKETIIAIFHSLDQRGILSLSRVISFANIPPVEETMDEDEWDVEEPKHEVAGTCIRCT